MEIKRLSNSDSIQLIGEFTIYSVSEFKNYITKEFEAENAIQKIDLSQLTRIDTAGIQALIALKKFLESKHTKLELYNHSESVIAILELYGLLAYFGNPVKLNKSQREVYTFPYGRKKGFY